MSDTILTSINEGDIKAHFTNEISKKCIFNSDLKATQASFFANAGLVALNWNPALQRLAENRVQKLAQEGCTNESNASSVK